MTDERSRPRPRPRTNRSFLALCLRLIVAITNFEGVDNPGREKLKL
jgi:hypothetical protein